MNEIFIAITIGLIAGLIDFIPMILMKLEKTVNISAFVYYFILGLIISFVSWDIAPWIIGVIISFFSAIPFMIIFFPKDKIAIVPILVFSLILGAGIGIAGAKFVGW